MRTLLVGLAILIFTPYYSAIMLLAMLVGFQGERSPLKWGPQAWSRKILRASGAKVTLHDWDRIKPGTAQVLVVNHVSWFDVFALAGILPRYSFVAKAELQKYFLFGPAAKASGQIFIDRANRNAAFAEYEKAAVRIREGVTVVIFPEGSRGRDYTLRPFKKGPFVLAIAAGAPIIPILVHGTIAVNKKGSLQVHASPVHLHALEPIPTEGLTYDHRDMLARKVYEALNVAQQKLYGITSPEWTKTHPPAADPVVL